MLGWTELLVMFVPHYNVSPLRPAHRFPTAETAHASYVRPYADVQQHADGPASA